MSPQLCVSPGAGLKAGRSGKVAVTPSHPEACLQMVQKWPTPGLVVDGPFIRENGKPRGREPTEVRAP